MYVCVCYAVTTAKVKKVIEEGATSVDEVGRVCQAGTDCGSCRFKINRLIREQRPTQDGADSTIANVAGQQR